jgi:hypothetical protein
MAAGLGSFFSLEDILSEIMDHSFVKNVKNIKCLVKKTSTDCSSSHVWCANVINNNLASFFSISKPQQSVSALLFKIHFA